MEMSFINEISSFIDFRVAKKIITKFNNIIKVIVEIISYITSLFINCLLLAII